MFDDATGPVNGVLSGRRIKVYYDGGGGDVWAVTSGTGVNNQTLVQLSLLLPLRAQWYADDSILIGRVQTLMLPKLGRTILLPRWGISQ